MKHIAIKRQTNHGLLSSATEPHKVKEDKIHVYEIGFISLVFFKDLSQNGDASSSSLY